MARTGLVVRCGQLPGAPHLLLVVVLLFLLAGCAGLPQATGGSPGPPPSISVRTDRNRYAVGDPILVTVRNDLDLAVRYLGLCALYRCQAVEGDWRCETKECDAPLEILEAGTQLDIKTDTASLAGTRWHVRFDYQVDAEEVQRTAISNEFAVE
jgi:hypothetical protein